MASTLSCDEDHVNLAEFCCTCTYPLPCLCAQCKDTHLSKPGHHHLLPLSVQANVTSKKDSAKLQLRIHQLDLTYTELRNAFGTFQTVRQEIEAAYQDMEHMLTETKEKHLAKINSIAEMYELQINKSMQETYNNAWREQDFTPSDSFAALIWKHDPCKDDDLQLHYRIDVEKELVEQLCTLSWKLPFPDSFCSEEDSFPIKITLDSGATESVFVRPKQTIAEVKSNVRRQITSLPEEFYLTSESGELQNDYSVEYCQLTNTSELRLTSQIAITVITASTESLPLTVDLNSTVSHLFHSLEMPVGQFMLLCEGKRLRRDYSLAQCGLGNGAVVTVEQAISMPFALVVHLPAEQAQTIQVSSPMLISAVKELINEEQGLQSEQYSLTCMGQELNDQWSLMHYSIEESSSLTLVPRELRHLQIIVDQNHTKIINLDVSQWNTVEIVMKQLRDLSVGQDKLYFNGEVMQKRRFLISFGLKNSYILQTYEILIYVKLETGKVFPLCAQKNDLIETIKWKIEIQESFPVYEQNLFYDRFCLEDSRTLEDYNIQRKSVLRLVLREPGSMQIILNIYQSGQILTVNVSTSDTIEMVKNKIYAKSGILLYRQSLRFQGNVLKDCKTLRDYNIQSNSTIDLYVVSES